MSANTSDNGGDEKADNSDEGYVMDAERNFMR
jgi:hypothetical protein